MKYWQLSTRRMSRAARKLVMDGAWHPFASAEHAWYRVHGKLLQRVLFDSADEEDLLKASLDKLLPLKESLHTSGFQEELVLRADESEMSIEVLFGYPIADENNMQTFESELRALALRSKILDALLFVFAPIESLSTKHIAAAQTRIAEARHIYQTQNAKFAK